MLKPLKEKKNTEHQFFNLQNGWRTGPRPQPKSALGGFLINESPHAGPVQLVPYGWHKKQIASRTQTSRLCWNWRPKNLILPRDRGLD